MKDMIRINQIKLNIGLNNWDKALRKRAANILKVNDSDIEKLIIVKHSIDARKKPELYDVFSIDVCLRGKSRKEEEQIVKRCRDKNVSIVELKEYSFAKKIGLNEGKELSAEGKIADKRIVVIGAGPAGLFCGYELAMAGFKPLILERGADVDKRLDIVSKFWRTGKLDLKTNVQFGEGGAGTFSDGKLNTMVKDKEGRGSEALDIFVKNGAPEKIKYESKPHIGTDILKDVVKNIRNEIIKSGGEVLFETQVTELVLDEAGALKAVVAGDKEYPCEACVLAIGHSARDTFKMLYDREVDMQPKPFAVGFRVGWICCKCIF